MKNADSELSEYKKRFKVIVVRIVLLGMKACFTYEYDSMTVAH